MGKQIAAEVLRELSPDMDKFRAFEREVIGSIHREVDERKGKIEQSRVNRERKAKKKRQRRAASMG
jgi:hypothetical protein